MKKPLTLVFLLICVAFASAAQASYVESCQIKGRVVSEPETKRIYFMNNEGLEVEREETSFQFKVTKSTVNGRADSGCRHFVGQTLRVMLNGGFAAVKQIKIKQVLSLNYIAKDNSGTPRWESFWLPNIADMHAEPPKNRGYIRSVGCAHE